MLILSAKKNLNVFIPIITSKGKVNGSNFINFIDERKLNGSQL